MSEAIERVAPHAGGVWVVGADTICHQTLGPALRVEGIRPFGRSIEHEYEVRVRSSEGGDELSADVDGTPVELTFDAESGWLSGTARLETVGWHTIAFTGADSSTRRDVLVKRVPEVERSWAADIEPIYKASCAGSCHVAGSTDPIDLASLEAWTEHADAIRTEVVEARRMPKEPSSDWGSDDIEIVQEWLEGGMLP